MVRTRQPRAARHRARGVGVDIALDALPFEARGVERASSWVVSEQMSLFTCTASAATSKGVADIGEGRTASAPG